jgi:hypothetical protein
MFEDRTLLSTVNWINPAGGDWDTPSNWSTGKLPGLLDDVVINVPGNVTITHSNFNDAILSLTCNDNLVISGNSFISLSIATASVINGNLTISGGTLGGGGNLTLNGLFTWTSGTMTGGGHTVANGGMVLDTSNFNVLNLVNGRVLDNAATATWTGNGVGAAIGIGGDAVFNNLAGATLEVQSDAGLNGGTFNNAGLFRKSASSDTTSVTFLSRFNNTGTVDVETGTVNIQAGGVGSGTFEVADGATLTFSGYTLSSASTITGTGNLRFEGGATNLAGTIDFSGSTTIAGGTANFQRNVELPNLTISGGTLGGVGNVTVDGLLNWTGGTMSGVGHTVSNGQLVLTSSNDSFRTINLDGRTLDNAGTAVWLGTGPINFINASTLNNLAGATFEVESDAAMTRGFGGGPSTFKNAGTFLKLLSTDVTTIGILFNNDGLVDVQTGTLTLSGGGVSNGTFAVEDGAVLNFSGGTQTLGTASGITGVGSVMFTGGTTNMKGTYSVIGGTTVGGGTPGGAPGGTANFLTDVQLPALTLTGTGTLGGQGNVMISGLLTWTGGTMTGLGLTLAEGGIAISGTATKGLDGRTLNNFGTATWLGTGNIGIINGGVFNNLPGATFDVRNNTNFGSGSFTMGFFNNMGTIRKSVSLGATTFNMTFNNTGIVDVQTGTFGLGLGGVNNGMLLVEAGATLNFNAPGYVLSTSSTVTGPGSVLFSVSPFFGGASTNISGVFNVSGGTTITGGVVNFLTDEELSALTISGGMLTGSGNVTIDGLLTWTGGTITGLGDTLANGGINISGFGGKTLDGRTIENAGTAIWAGTGNITVANGAIWNNLANATFDGRSNATMSGIIGAPSSFNNMGTFRKSVSSAMTTMGLLFNNDGLVDVETGTLDLAGGGVSNGSITVASGTTLRFGGGTYTINPSSTISGPGNFIVGSDAINLPPSVSVVGTYSISGATTITGGTANFFNDIDLPNLTLSGGTLTGLGNVTIGGTLTWNGGTMSGTGNTVAKGSTHITTSVSTGPTLDGRTFINAGTVTWTSPNDIRANNGAIFDNLPGAVFDVQTDASFGNSSGFSPLFINEGTFRKSVGNGTNQVIEFTNTGTLDVETGSVFLAAGLTNFSSPTSTLIGGTYVVKGKLFINAFSNNGNIIINAATIVLDGSAAQISDQFSRNLLANFALNTSVGSFAIRNGRNIATSASAFTNEGSLIIGSSSTFTVSGTYTQTAGTTTLSGGTLTATTVSIQGGSLSGSGTVNGNVTNAGLVSPGGDGVVGILTINGNYTQTAAGGLNIDLDGTTQGTSYDWLKTSGVASLDGTLTVSLLDSFSPQLNNSFKILTFGSRSGNFATENFPDLGTLFLNPVFDSTSLTLVTQSI